MKQLVRSDSVVVLLALLVGIVIAWQAVPAQAFQGMAKDPIQVGYAVVTPTSSANTGLVVFETFGEAHGNDSTQAGVLPSDMTTRAMLFVSTNGRLSRNLGVAIANPDPLNAATVTLLLRDANGNLITPAGATVTVPAKNQVSRFVTELFANQPSVPKNLTGTLEITSSIPVAVVGLRFRGSNFSTLPATSLSGPFGMPVISTGVGGTGAIILAQFASGGGWATQMVLSNTGSADLVVRVDLFQNNGTPLVATLNGKSGSSFTSINIPKGGVVVLSPGNGMDDDDPF